MNNITLKEDYKYILWSIETTKCILYYIYTVLFPIGIGLNLFEIFLFQSIKLQKTTMAYFFSINSALNILIISYLLVFIPPSTRGVYLHLISDMSCRLYYFFLRVLYQSSSWLYVLITADRLLFILFPKRFKFQQNKFILSVIIFVCLAIICCTNIPNFMMYLVVVKTNNSNQTFETIYCTAKPDILTVRDVFMISMRDGLPFFLMLFMNAALIFKVKESKKNLKLVRNLNQHLKFAFTVIATTFIFMFIMLPNIAYIIISNIFLNGRSLKQPQTNYAFLVLFETISSIGFFSNYSFSFLIQLSFNTIFRKQFYRFIYKILKIFNHKIKIPENLSYMS